MVRISHHASAYPTNLCFCILCVPKYDFVYPLCIPGTVQLYTKHQNLGVLKGPRREVVRSSAGMGVVYSSFLAFAQHSLHAPPPPPHPWPCVTFTLLVVVSTSQPGIFMMTAYRALIRPSGEDAMGRSCILDSHPGRWMPAVVRMPACHSRRFKGERPIGAATG